MNYSRNVDDIILTINPKLSRFQPIAIQQSGAQKNQTKSSVNNTTSICSQEFRKDFIANKCKDHKDRQRHGNKTSGRFIIDDIHKLVYCVTPKIACSTFKTVMVNISMNGKLPSSVFQPGQLRSLHANIDSNKYKSYGLRRQGSYTSDLDSYTKFVVVRNPMDRLVSGFYDKMQGGDVTYSKYAFEVSRKYHTSNNSNMSTSNDTHNSNTTKDVYPTFREFITMLLDNKMPIAWNEHFNNYFWACNPCYIKYDDVLKLETLEDELEPFLKRMYGDNVLYYVYNSRLNSVVSSVSKHITVPTYTKHLPEFKKLSKTELDRIMDKYREEFLFYGYTFNSDMKAGCGYGKGDDCC